MESAATHRAQPCHRRAQQGERSAAAGSGGSVSGVDDAALEAGTGDGAESPRRSGLSLGYCRRRTYIVLHGLCLFCTCVVFLSLVRALASVFGLLGDLGGSSARAWQEEESGAPLDLQAVPAGPVDRARWRDKLTPRSSSATAGVANGTDGEGQSSKAAGGDPADLRGLAGSRDGASLSGDHIAVPIMAISPMGKNYTPRWPLFWILTAPKYETTRCREILSTWGALVPPDSLVFLGAARNWSTSDGYRFIALDAPPQAKAVKEILAWRLVVEEFAGREWYVKGDDDTYFVVGNLNRYLEEFEPRLPYFLGCKFHLGGPGGFQYVSGGAGYVLSLEAARRLPGATATCLERYGKISEGDIAVSECLQIVGVTPEDTRDERGSQRFHAFGYDQHLQWYKMGLHVNKWWYQDWVWGPMIEGRGCCSDNTTVSFHYMASRMKGFTFPNPPAWWLRASKFVRPQDVPFFRGRDAWSWSGFVAGPARRNVFRSVGGRCARRRHVCPAGRRRGSPGALASHEA